MLELFTRYFAQLSYLIIVLATLAEGLTIPCPSLAVLLMAGAAASTSKVSFWMTVVLASASYTAGALVPYLIGYHIPRLQTVPMIGRFVGASLRYLRQVNALFERHGEKIVALARPFWIGNCVSYFAGLNRMAPWKFLLFTFIGISGWSFAVVYLGYMFSSNLAKAAALIRQYSWFAMVILAGICTWLVVRHFRSHRDVSSVRE